MQLHFLHQPTISHQFISQPSSSHSLLFLHGLFGSLSNLSMLANTLNTHYATWQFDLRNHGLSPHSNEIDYSLMALDVIETVNAHQIEKATIIGHSMGGKVAMKIANLKPAWLEKLIVLDIAPTPYPQWHIPILNALAEVEHQAAQQQQLLSRTEVTQVLQTLLPKPSVIPFLLKSWKNGKWCFNVSALKKSYPLLADWQPIAPLQIESLFIGGGKSSYINIETEKAIFAQFPHAIVETIADCGHWLHSEKTAVVAETVGNFINK